MTLLCIVLVAAMAAMQVRAQRDRANLEAYREVTMAMIQQEDVRLRLDAWLLAAPVGDRRICCDADGWYAVVDVDGTQVPGLDNRPLSLEELAEALGLGGES